jgi:peptidoglycan/LPS O-acetylase OafA/YrhL
MQMEPGNRAFKTEEFKFKGNYRILDSYRFIAASLICIYHFNKDNILGLTSLSYAFENIRLMVDFFFILSGFVIAKNYLHHIHDVADYRRFMWRRIVRLYPLHLLTLMVSLAGAAMLGHRGISAGFHPDTFSLKAFIANLTLTHSLGVTEAGSFNSPSWSISAEIFVYALFPLFAFLVTRLPALLNAALVVTYVGVTILLRDQYGLRDWTLTWYDMGALRAIPTFFTGVLIAHLLSTDWKNFSPPIWWAHAAFFLAFPSMHLDARDEWALIAFAFVVLFAAAAEQNGAKSLLQKRAFLHLGEASYALYMWHMPIKFGIFAVIGMVLGRDLLPMWFAAILSYCIALFVAMVCYRLFELPIRSYMIKSLPLKTKPEHQRQMA